MIIGLEQFKKHFAEHTKSFVLIGGVACDLWFASQGLEFRVTKDIDIVRIVEALDKAFVVRFWEFVEAGKYQVREKVGGDREFYHFSKPADTSFPAMLELFSRKPGMIELGEQQKIVPVEADGNLISLSAILLDDKYYALIRENRQDAEVPFVTPSALIPLKARAWQDFTERRKNGNKVDSRDINKHRTDVFRIAATLPGEAGAEVAKEIQDDVKTFLAAFPEENEEWKSILESLKTPFGNQMLVPRDPIAAVQTYFHLV
jgi:hypothetical protein